MPFDSTPQRTSDAPTEGESLTGLIAFLRKRTAASARIGEAYDPYNYFTCAMGQYLISIGRPARTMWHCAGLTTSETSFIFGNTPTTWAGALARAQAVAASSAERKGTATDPSEQPST